jgi:predicted nucleic acid-binding protein
MADYLLWDSCIIIDYINGRSAVINDLLAKETHLFINSIIEMELLQGARDKKELQVIKKNYFPYACLI